MPFEARYKVGEAIAGPRPLDDIRRDIESGALARETPLQLTTDGLGTTLDGAEKKLGRFKQPSVTRSLPFVFILANLILAGGGYFFPWICPLAAGGSYLTGIVLRHFEGRMHPAAALTNLVTMIFPMLVVYLADAPPISPLVRWLYGSAFAQFTLFCAFVHLGR